MTGRRIPAARTIAASLTAVALVGVSACGGGSSKPSGTGKTTAAGAAATTSASPQATPLSVAQAFLTAWSGSDFTGAGALTDDTTNATNRLKAVMTSLGAKKVTLALGSQQNVPTGAASGTPSGATPGSSTSSGAPAAGSSTSAGSTGSSNAGPLARYGFTVTADFGNNLVWTYQSLLDLVQGPAGAPVVHWSSAVINPQLGGTALLKAVPPKQSVVDYSGTPIDTTAHPTLGPVVSTLSSHVPANTTPTQLTVEFVDPKTGSQIPQSQIWKIGTPGAPAPTIKTTIKPSVQSAIEKALKKFPNSGMVAIQPSTGGILGMASNDPSFTALEYQGTRAPGSTFKVVTTALALQQGLKPSDSVNCSPNAKVEGQTINNDSGLRQGFPNATLKDAFEISCNTAYVNMALTGKLGSDYSALTNEAKTYFGMNQKWDLGMGQATYGTPGDQQVPPAKGQGDFAREVFGQGEITMSPLTMASVAATVCTGQFKQPILVQGTKQISATPLPAAVDSQLTTLMLGVVNDSIGTATTVFPHNVGIAAKTGSAESDDTPTTDSWMIAFDKKDDIAFAALVLNGGMGYKAAGPVIASAMSSLGVG